jgi:hypothetical protein
LFWSLFGHDDRCCDWVDHVEYLFFPEKKWLETYYIRVSIARRVHDAFSGSQWWWARFRCKNHAAFLHDEKTSF